MKYEYLRRETEPFAFQVIGTKDGLVTISGQHGKMRFKRYMRLSGPLETKHVGPTVFDPWRDPGREMGRCYGRYELRIPLVEDYQRTVTARYQVGRRVNKVSRGLRTPERTRL